MGYIFLTLEALLFLTSAFLIGYAVLAFLGAAYAPLRRFAISCMLGLGAWSLMGTFLAALGLFDPNILRGLMVLVFIVSFNTLQTFSLSSFLERARVCMQTEIPLKALIAAWLLVEFVIVFMPITGEDTFRYHLPIMQDLIVNERLSFSPTVINYPYLPLAAETLYAIPSSIFGTTQDPYIFQLIQFSAFLLLLLLIFDFVKTRVRNPFFAPIAVLATLSLMDLQREVFHGGYIDVVAFLFAVGSFLVLLDHLERKRTLEGPETLISAAFLGIALSMKYHALIFVGLDGLLLLLGAWYMRRRLLSAALTVLRYGGIAFFVAGFWYIKNYFLFGNPVYPLFESEALQKEIGNVGWWIADRTWLNMLLFPVYRYGRWFYDATESSSHLVTLGYFFLTYACAAFFAIRRLRVSLSEVALFGALHIYLWVMFFNSHQNRYLLGGVILLPILLTLFSDRFYSHALEGAGERVRRFVRKSAVVLAAVAFLVTFGGFVHYFQYKFWYVVGRDTKTEYIENIGGL